MSHRSVSFTVRARSQESAQGVSPLRLFRRCGEKPLMRAKPYCWSAVVVFPSNTVVFPHASIGGDVVLKCKKNGVDIVLMGVTSQACCIQREVGYGNEHYGRRKMQIMHGNIRRPCAGC